MSNRSEPPVDRETDRRVADEPARRPRRGLLGRRHTHEQEAVAAAPVADHHEQRRMYGGVKWGSAFFGFLTALGVATLLTALLSAAGTAVGLANGATPDNVTQKASADAGTVGLIGIVVLAVIVFVAYYCGGYVAGRMARFDGVRQGLAVWLWALIIAIVVAVLAAVFGSQYDVLANLDSFPRLPLSEGTLTTAGVIAAVVVVAASLIGALLGGLAGMAFHRRVDRAAGVL